MTGSQREASMERAGDPEQHGLESATAGLGFDAYQADVDDAFRRHFDAALAAPGRTLEAFWPAYRYGYDLGRDRRGDWAAVEPAVRRKWEQLRLGEWEEFAGAVRYAWECGRRMAA